jgi:hypothetical protein
MVEKEQKQSWTLVSMTVCAQALILHKQWIHLEMQRHTNITECNQYLYNYK